VGPNTIVFASKPGVSVYYLFELVRGLTTTHEYKRHWNELVRKKVISAPRNLTDAYADFVRPSFVLMAKLRSISRNLRTSRDLLLPKLISGKIDLERASQNAKGTPERVAAE
jgi:type I restriction enzyme S subunit